MMSKLNLSHLSYKEVKLSVFSSSVQWSKICFKIVKNGTRSDFIGFDYYLLKNLLRYSKIEIDYNIRNSFPH